MTDGRGAAGNPSLYPVEPRAHGLGLDVLHGLPGRVRDAQTILELGHGVQRLAVTARHLDAHRSARGADLFPAPVEHFSRHPFESDANRRRLAEEDVADGRALILRRDHGDCLLYT